MAEQWRPVKGCEGLYEVSDQGRVRSVDRVISQKNGSTKRLRGHMLKPFTDWSGHYFVRLGRTRLSSVHLLVAEAFIGAREDGCVVRHLNGDPSDNCLSNLAYGSQSDNLRDCYSYGQKSGSGKLYREHVLEIRNMLARGVPQRYIAEQYGLSQQSVSNINCRKTFGYI